MTMNCEARRAARRGAVLLVLACMSATSEQICAEGAGGVIRDYATVAFMSYRAAQRDARALAESVDGFLARPDRHTHAVAQAAWLRARASYGQTEVMRFYSGPIDRVEDDGGSAGPELRLNAWPLDEGFIDYVRGHPGSGIINDPAVPITQDTLIARNVLTDETHVSTGYHAIEFLLWGQDFADHAAGQRPVTDYIPGTPVNERRREYLKVVTRLVGQDLTLLVKAWAPGRSNYRAHFVALDERVALNHILTGMIQLSGFELAMERLAVPLDSREQEDEHSCFSDNTHNDLIANIVGMENVYYGRYDSFQGVGLAAYLSRRSPELHGLISEQLTSVHTIARALEPPFDQLLKSPAASPERARAEELVQGLQTLSDLLKVVRATVHASSTEQ